MSKQDKLQELVSVFLADIEKLGELDDSFDLVKEDLHTAVEALCRVECNCEHVQEALTLAG